MFSQYGAARGAQKERLDYFTATAHWPHEEIQAFFFKVSCDWRRFLSSSVPKSLANVSLIVREPKQHCEEKVAGFIQLANRAKRIEASLRRHT